MVPDLWIRRAIVFVAGSFKLPDVLLLSPSLPSRRPLRMLPTKTERESPGTTRLRMQTSDIKMMP